MADNTRWCAVVVLGRHETAVIAALLHDVLDDTPTTPEQLTAAFGPAVSAMVVKVSKLSQVNQMLRRDKRKVGPPNSTRKMHQLVSSRCFRWHRSMRT